MGGLKKILFIFLKIIYGILLLIWALSYGCLTGLIGKTYACYEDWLCTIKNEIHQWRRFPQRSLYRKAQNIWLKQEDRNYLFKDSEIEKIKDQLQTKHHYTSLIFVKWTIFFLGCLPFKMFSGLVAGWDNALEKGRIFWEAKVLATSVEQINEMNLLNKSCQSYFEKEEKIWQKNL